ncbi:hypothetical protein BX600DRAFT_446913 [Xylariales sp. PMI_506]|nr:hypothetical protein BX600DRAFT_446913 [Xylariales sp. PMI_506]
MFLPGFLGGTKQRRSASKSRPLTLKGHETDASSARSRSPEPISPAYISDESQLPPIPPLPRDVVDLNASLRILSAVFPDVQIEVFREMLSSFSEESRLAVVADAMLKTPSAYVKGRRRLRDGASQKEGRGAAAAAAPAPAPVTAAAAEAEAAEGEGEGERVPRADAFRGTEYKSAVRSLALQEFKGLSRSAIDAVLSEWNHSYLDARPTLVELSSKSWKFTIQSIFFRRRPVTTGEAENHPLVVWKSSGQGSILPCIKSTGSAELDRELFAELISPLKRREAAAREEKDRSLAVELHHEEAEACEATYECACCYADATFEEFTTCNGEGHMICFRCVQHSITEAVFGQGWQRSIHKDTGTLRCPAVSSRECEGCVPVEHIHRAMQQEKGGAEVLRKMDQRLADHGLISSNLPLVRCPFCSYAEVDDLYVPSHRRKLRFRASNIPNVVLIFMSLLVSPLAAPLLALLVLALVLCCSRAFRRHVGTQLRAAVSRYQRRRLGLKFTCQNPECGRASCMSCSKAWVDIHVCHESSLVALRTQVEQAMSMAVKRVCPRCNTSFVKTAGCNKLTCPCGYKMCYVCRRDIGAASEGYQHFCQHFRPEGDGSRCQECTRCNLWEAENTDAILRQAKAEAERRWRETERRELSGAERAYLETGVASGSDGIVGRLVTGGKIPSMIEVYDSIVETLFVVGR